jgi:hypothetical protein
MPPSWLPISFSFIGVSLLFYASILLRRSSKIHLRMKAKGMK